MTWRLAAHEPSVSSRKAKVPLPCSLPVLTQPPTTTVWPAREAPPSGRLRIETIGTRFENRACGRGIAGASVREVLAISDVGGEGVDASAIEGVEWVLNPNFLCRGLEVEMKGCRL